jgi:transposase InsO family protein
MIARALRQWLAQLGTKTLHIEPGSSSENGSCESLTGKPRDEYLKQEIFSSLKEARVIIDAWRDHANRVRPHSSLGSWPPAPVTLEAIAQQLPTPTIKQ